MAQAGVNIEPKVTFHPAHEVFLPTALTVTQSWLADPRGRV